MSRNAYHPNAYLERIKNIKLGLEARTTILNELEKYSGDCAGIGRKIGMPYRVVRHHLRLLEAEEIAQKTSKRPYIWHLTGKGQKRLGTQS